MYPVTLQLVRLTQSKSSSCSQLCCILHQLPLDPNYQSLSYNPKWCTHSPWPEPWFHSTMWPNVILQILACAVEKLHWLQGFSTVCHFLPSLAWAVANLQWYAGADGWNGVWIPSDVVMKTPRLADCPPIWGAVSSKRGAVRPVNISFQCPGSLLDEDDALLGEIVLWSQPRRSQGMILGVNMYLSASLRRNPTATALLSHDYNSPRRLILSLSHYPTTLWAALTLWAPYSLNASLNHDYSECQSHSH